MKISNLFRKKVYVDKWSIRDYLNNFVKKCSSKMIVNIEVTDRGEVILSTNRPGVLIGPGGRDIDKISEEFKKYGAKQVTIKEMTYIASNCGIY